MFYYTIDTDDLTQLLTRLEFGASDIQFDDNLLNGDPAIEQLSSGCEEYPGKMLLHERESGAWCFLETEEYRVYRSFDGRGLKDILSRFSGEGQAELKEFIARLYWLGLLRVGGRRFFDSELFSNGPVTLPGPHFILLPTEQCNISCQYCFADSLPGKTRSMDWSVARRVIDRVLEYPADALTIEFTGGEPLIEMDLIERTIGYANERAREKGKGLRFVLQTNGTLLDESRLARIRDLNIEFSISLDGSRELNDATRRFSSDRGTYSAIMENIRRAQRMGLRFGIICVVSLANYRKIRELTDHFEDVGLEYLKFLPVFRLGRAKGEWAEIALSAGEFLEAHLEYLDYMLSNDKRVRDANVFFMLKNLGQKMHSYRCMRSQCGAGRDFFTFGPSGEIYPCDRYREYGALKLGDIERLGEFGQLNANNAIMSELEQRHAESVAECSRCTYKRYCEAGCPLDSYYEYGAVDRPHPWCEYYQGMFRGLFDRLAAGDRLAKVFCPDAVFFDRAFFRYRETA